MPKRSPVDTLSSLESGSDRLCHTPNGNGNFENDSLEEVNSVRSGKFSASGSDHIKVDARFEAFHNHPCRYNTEQYNSEKTLYPCTTLPSLSRDDGASSTANTTAFHVKNELTGSHSPTSQWSGRTRREEEDDTAPAFGETVQGGVHDIAKSTTEAVSLNTSEYCAGARNEEEERSCRRGTEEVQKSQVLSPSIRPLAKSSQSPVDCDSAWASLGYIDLRSTVTVHASTTTGMQAMPSYNLKNQSQSLPPSKEAGNAAGGVRTVFQCHTCQKEFVTEKYLCMHMALHRPLSSSNSPSSSSAAGKQGNSKLSISQSSDESVKLVKSDGSGASHWTCKICSKTFAQSSNYKNHIRTHSDERPFVCNVCSIGFKERYHLKKHILFKHTKELKEECRVCGKRFKDSTAVRAHERIHSEERPYGCQRCNKTFKTSECLWHHENRSRTCGKSLKGTADADGVTANPVPRFRRGRHPGKRTAPIKSKTVAEAEENSVGEASACLSLDHVEEISASVKIELEREIPEYYFKAVPGLYAYEFDNIMDVLMPDGSLTTGQEVVTFPSSQLSVNALDVINKNKQPDNDLHKSVPISVSATLGSRHLDHLAAQLWSNEWTSSSAGVFLGSPSRPVSASYDSIADAYSPGTPQKSWKQQDISNFRHGSAAVYVGEISNADLVKSPNFNVSRYTQQKQQQHQQQAGQQIQSSAGAHCATTAATGGLPFASLMQQINDAKPEIRHSGSMQTHMQHIRRSYADDFGPTDEASRSVLALTSIPASDLWPSKMGELVPVVGGAPGRSQESSATNAAASYPISIANVPTAVVAPFKRESTNRPAQVNGTEADQPVKNSLPPFETFAPMTLRVQKSQQAISTPIPSLSPIVASYATFASPYSSDGSIADQCPTIQKYLLRGHPNAAIKPNRNLPEDLGQREISVNFQWHTPSPVRPLTPKDSWKRSNVHSNHFPMEQDRAIAGRQLGPEFVSESQLKLSGLISLPGEMDATQSFNFIKMAPASYSQSAILQPLAEISDSNARSVNLHRKI